jgi:3-hydroxyacyl-CoA dehydrogenase
MDGIKKVAVIGTGVIGSAWVSLFAQKGYEVTGYSRRPETRDKGYRQVCSNLDFFVGKGILTVHDRDQALY